MHGEVRQVLGQRHRIVHEATGQERAFGGIKGFFHHRGANTLGQTSVHLAVHDHGVYEDAEVIDGNKVEELHGPLSGSTLTTATFAEYGNV